MRLLTLTLLTGFSLSALAAPPNTPAPVAASHTQPTTSAADAAKAARERAAKGTVREVVKALQEACKQEPNNPENWKLLAEAQSKTGDLAAAKQTYQSMLQLVTASDAPAARNARVQALIGLGETASAQGDVPGAMAHYQRALTISSQLHQDVPNNSTWEESRYTVYKRLGDAQQAQGQLATALASYQQSQDIAQKQLQAQPDNTTWQRNLSVSYDRIGTIQQAQGDLPEALAHFRNGHDIFEKLARIDPANSEWQNDLSISLERVGGIQQGSSHII